MNLQVVDVPSQALVELYRRSRQTEKPQFPSPTTETNKSLTEELELNLATTSTPVAREHEGKPSTSHDVALSPQHHPSVYIYSF